MRKLLFVHEEQHVDRALRNVKNLLHFEQIGVQGSATSDLLAVVVLSLDIVHAILSAEQECALRPSSDGSAVFGPDSVSLNGIWTLVTLSRRDLQEPMTRNGALDRVLVTLQNQGFVQDWKTVFLLSPSQEHSLSIREPLASFKTEQPPN